MKRFSIMAVITLLLAFSATSVTIAQADDGVPPAATEEPVSPVEPGDDASSPPVAEEIVPTEPEDDPSSPPVAEEIVPTEPEDDPSSPLVTTEEGASGAPSSPEAPAAGEELDSTGTETTPANTEDPKCISISDGEQAQTQDEGMGSDLPFCAPKETENETVVDAGEPNPESDSLASPEEAQTLFSGDPMWCPAGVLPGGAGCTGSFAAFSGPGGLITALGTGAYSGAGTIYISWDYSVSETIHLDYGNNFLTDLIFQGGWDFMLNRVVGETTFSKEIDFYDWGGYDVPGSLTINDININALAADGLYIADLNDITTANVTLNNVSVANQDGGAFIETTGSVTINNSQFTNNFTDGLSIYTDGNVILNNVTASGNTWDGVYIAGNQDKYAESVSVNGGTFASNGSGTSEAAYGLEVSACQLNLNDTQSFGGNKSGDVLFVQDPDCVEKEKGEKEEKDEKKPVTGTSSSSLCADSELSAGTVKGMLHNLCGVAVVMSETPEEDLPLELAEGTVFHLGIKISTVGGIPTGGYIELNFPIPDGVDPAKLVVLFWNGTEWEQVPGAEIKGDILVVKVSKPGFYTLTSGE